MRNMTQPSFHCKQIRLAGSVSIALRNGLIERLNWVFYLLSDCLVVWIDGIFNSHVTTSGILLLCWCGTWYLAYMKDSFVSSQKEEEKNKKYLYHHNYHKACFLFNLYVFRLVYRGIRSILMFQYLSFAI